jgi:hypothetical protein
VTLFVIVGHFFTFLTFYFDNAGYKSEDSSANGIDANSIEANSSGGACLYCQLCDIILKLKF